MPIAKDIELLNSRVDAPLECPGSIPIVVHRHKLRDALNKEKLQEASQVSNVPVAHCLVNIIKRNRMSRSEAYCVKGGGAKVKGDGILSVIPGASLLLTQNIDIPFGIFKLYSKLICNRPCQWCYCRILQFCRQGRSTDSRSDHYNASCLHVGQIKTRCRH